jgi:hypothetical protein
MFVTSAFLPSFSVLSGSPMPRRMVCHMATPRSMGSVKNKLWLKYLSKNIFFSGNWQDYNWLNRPRKTYNLTEIVFPFSVLKLEETKLSQRLNSDYWVEWTRVFREIESFSVISTIHISSTDEHHSSVQQWEGHPTPGTHNLVYISWWAAGEQAMRVSRQAPSLIIHIEKVTLLPSSS